MPSGEWPLSFPEKGGYFALGPGSSPGLRRRSTTDAPLHLSCSPLGIPGRIRTRTSAIPISRPLFTRQAHSTRTCTTPLRRPLPTRHPTTPAVVGRSLIARRQSAGPHLLGLSWFSSERWRELPPFETLRLDKSSPGGTTATRLTSISATEPHTKKSAASPNHGQVTGSREIAAPPGNRALAR